jgi:5-methylcytosine-specific restriction enzyme A
MTAYTIERPWQRWYGLQRWRNRAALQMKIEPLCRMCLANNHIEAAYVADHIVPHHGDSKLFWFGELQSLCATHHSGDKATIDRGGVVKNYSGEIGIDGWPIDPKHPSYMWGHSKFERAGGRSSN